MAVAERTPPSPRLTEETTDLSGRILAEATRLFAERGFSGTSIREVVEAAGCTKPALYYHFASKEGLFLGCIRAQTDRFTEIIEGTEQLAGTPRARMTEGLRLFFDYVRSQPMGIRLVWRAEMQPESDQPAFDFDSLRTWHITMVKQRLMEARDAGEVREGVDLDDATHALCGIIDQRLDLWARGGDLPADLPERILRLFFEGVGP
jgi:TetR/AcrR family transcriptional regulator